MVAFASALGLSAAQSSLALTLVNAASIFAGFCMGYLSDRYNVWVLAFTSLLLTSLATFLLWGVLANSLTGILAYGAVYGITAGCWSSMWNGFVKPIASACSPPPAVHCVYTTHSHLFYEQKTTHRWLRPCSASSFQLAASVISYPPRSRLPSSMHESPLRSPSVDPPRRVLRSRVVSITL